MDLIWLNGWHNEGENDTEKGNNANDTYLQIEYNTYNAQVTISDNFACLLLTSIVTVYR